MCLWMYGGMLTYIHQDVQIRERWQHRVNQGAMAAVQLRMTSATHGRWESEEGTRERIKHCLKTSENRCGTPTCCFAESWDASLKLCDALVLRMLAAQANLGFFFFKYCKYTYHIVFFFFFNLINFCRDYFAEASWMVPQGHLLSVMQYHV